MFMNLENDLFDSHNLQIFSLSSWAGKKHNGQQQSQRHLKFEYKWNITRVESKSWNKIQIKCFWVVWKTGSFQTVASWISFHFNASRILTNVSAD